MNKTENRRRAPRLRYRVTVYYSENTEGEATTFEGQMLDISSGGLAFRCNVDESCPREDQQLKLRFSIPNSKVHDASMMEFVRTGCVLRVQEVNPTLRNVAVRFDEPLPVGKVFFDTIGLYHSAPETEVLSAEENTGEDPSMEAVIEQRIKELERELEQLKQLQFKSTLSPKTE